MIVLIQTIVLLELTDTGMFHLGDGNDRFLPYDAMNDFMKSSFSKSSNDIWLYTTTNVNLRDTINVKSSRIVEVPVTDDRRVV
jgi:hypothetical protein